jgi:uncharacterized protein (TIGR03086 family)
MHTNFDRIKAMNARAVQHSVALIEQVTAQDWSRSTPCSAWDLSGLLGHMTAQHRGFAAAAAGVGDDLTRWRVHPLGDDAVAQYADAAEGVLAAFATVETAGQAVVLPEISTTHTLPAATAIGFHLIDYLVHSWDVAATLGIAFDPDPELVEVAMPIAMAVPNEPQRYQPNSAFHPALPVADSLSTMDQILNALGRSPQWRSTPVGRTT